MSFRSLAFCLALCLGLSTPAWAILPGSATETVSGTFKPGGAVVYTVTLTNDVSSDRPHVTPVPDFSQTLPAALTQVSVSATSGEISYVPETREITWIGDIAAHSSVTLQYQATISPTAGATTVSTYGLFAVNDSFLIPTEDPTSAQPSTGTNFTVRSPSLRATQTVTGNFAPGSVVTYTVQIANTGTAEQPDNAGHEFLETLPADLTLLSATATSGEAVAGPGNVVTWDGVVPQSYPSSGNGGPIVVIIGEDPTPAVAITITARLNLLTEGHTVTTAGQIAFDKNLDGVSETTASTIPASSPTRPFASSTVFSVPAFQDIAFIPPGSRAVTVDVLANDALPGSAHHLVSVGTATHGQTAVGTDLVSYTLKSRLPAGGDSFTYAADDGAGGDAYQFDVAVHTFADAAGTYQGLLGTATGTPEFALMGEVTVTVGAGGSFTGAVALGGEQYPIRGTLNSAGVAQFGPHRALSLQLPARRPAPSAADAPVSISFGFTNDLALDKISVQITRDGVQVAQTLATRLAAPPESVQGAYTFFWRQSSASWHDPASAPAPTTNGFGRLVVQRNGRATYTSVLPDGTPVSGVTLVRKSIPPLVQTDIIILLDPLHDTAGYECSLHQQLYRNGGAISGKLTFLKGSDGLTDLISPELRWAKPPLPADPLFPNGWLGAGVPVELFGSKFTATARAQILPGVGMPSATGNVSLHLDSADAEGLQLTLSANLDSHPMLRFISPTPSERPEVTILPTGFYSGRFLDPATHRWVPLRGAIVQKYQAGYGLYLSGATYGNANLQPAQ